MLEFGKALDVGIKRKGKKNQDALDIIEPRSKQPFLIVADGMGGFKGGAEASRIVIDTMKKAYRKRGKKANLAELMYQTILESHQNIIKRSKSSEELAKMGSTIACVSINEADEKVVVANVGDTRVYLIDNQKIQLVSHDHSEVAELTRHGVLNETEARDYVRKNVLTMSLAAHRPPEKVKPFVTQVAFPKGSLLLLCSDGLWGCGPDHLIRLVALEYHPQKAVEKLVEIANTSGGPDNISILIARRKGEWEAYCEKHSTNLEDTL
jgi:protein phosphatase